MLRCDVVPYFLYPSDYDAKVAWWENECGFSELGSFNELTMTRTSESYNAFYDAAQDYIHRENIIFNPKETTFSKE